MKIISVMNCVLIKTFVFDVIKYISASIADVALSILYIGV